VFFSLLFVSAPYGRHYRCGWGAAVPAWSAWLFMEFPAFGVILLFFILHIGSFQTVSFIFLLLWETHYIYRTFVYPMVFRGRKKEFPFLLVFFALVFNAMNGTINGEYLFAMRRYDLFWLLDPRFVLGTAMFLGGMATHIWADRVLRFLRRPGEKGYGIPKGGLYRWISCPNYFGEILEWSGFAVLTWSPTGLAFAVFTFANLAPRALFNHRWYLNNFSDYPKDRKALIPFVL
jgi:3-oxo-5-alpha-steroid 4-dehydrogenase 1